MPASAGVVALCCVVVAALLAGPGGAFAKKPVHRGGPMVEIMGDSFTMGGHEKSGAPGTRHVELEDYEIDETPVTNQQYREFVKETKYKTESEKFGWSFVLDLLLSDEVREANTQTVKDAPQWVAVEGSWWRAPEGKGSNLQERWDHPVVQVSWNDAKEFCKWAGKRLPSEAEWEFAARGGLYDKLYPWGKGTKPMGKGDKWMMNVWQGKFPKENTAEDGYISTSPVKAFPPNAYGAYSMLGNVWEWVEDHFPTKDKKDDQVVLKGGSYLDTTDGSHNHPVTVVTRMGNTKDSGGGNTGFRCARGKGGGHRRPPMNQELMQQIVAEKGVEGLQEYLAQTGGGSVMTPAMLKEKQAEIKRMKEQMEAQAAAAGHQEL